MRQIFASLFVMLAVDAAASTPAWPRIENVFPPFGRPSGGDVILLDGYHFHAPVRVFVANIEAEVLSVSPELLSIRTPAFELPPGKQSVPVEITVITHAGTKYELKRSRERAFEFRNEILTPFIHNAWPWTAPSTGGTEIRLFGEGFQFPIRAFLLRGDAVIAELRAGFSDYNNIVVHIPPAGDVPLYESLDLRIENRTSKTQTVLRDAFRYVPAPTIEAVAPNSGSRFGGTRVIIEGTAFEDYVSVDVAGVTATSVLVTPTRIEAITTPIYFSPCDDVTGPIIVRHMNGATASGGEFTYVTRKKSIESIPQEPAIAGGTIDIVLADDAGAARAFTIGGIAVTPLRSRPDGVAGRTVWTLPVPATLASPRRAPQTFELVVSTETAGCLWQDKATITVLSQSEPRGPLRGGVGPR